MQNAGEDKIKNFANYQIQFLNKSIQIIKYLKNKILKQEYNFKISFYIFGFKLLILKRFKGLNIIKIRILIVILDTLDRERIKNLSHLFSNILTIVPANNNLITMKRNPITDLAHTRNT